MPVLWNASCYTSNLIAAAKFYFAMIVDPMQERTRPEDRGKEDEKSAFLPDGPLDLPKTSTLTYGVDRGSASIKPEDEGKIKGQAVRAMEEQTRRELDMLEEQARVILAQASAIKKRKEISKRIYNATIRLSR